jgi:hypothetical protein
MKSSAIAKFLAFHILLILTEGEYGRYGNDTKEDKHTLATIYKDKMTSKNGLRSAGLLNTTRI